MRRAWVVVLSGLLLVTTAIGMYAALSPDGLAQRAAGRAGVVKVADVAVPMAGSPSPTLGSTPQPGVNGPGDRDGDPNDYDRVPLVVISFVALGVLVAGSVVFYLRRRSRQNS